MNRNGDHGIGTMPNSRTMQNRKGYQSIEPLKYRK